VRHSARRLLTAGTACALSAAALAPGAQAAPFRVVGTGGTLHVRTAPSLGAIKVEGGDLPDGTIINIVCQTRGDQVVGSTMWDRIDGRVAGYVADWYTTTPVVNNPSPGLPDCSQVTPPPDPRPDPPGVPLPPPPPAIVPPQPQASVATRAESHNHEVRVPSNVAKAWHVGPYWSGYCEAFVGYVTAWPRGRGYGSAIADYRDHLRRGLIRKGVPPRGAVVYWNPPESDGYGHVGVSLGNNKVISTVGGSRDRLPITIHKISDFRNYLCWAMP
jgi:hypothetical protein